ncbi:alpha-amylase family protein [Paenibacillus nasutitermitis]|uniref:Beta-galactosidase trimerisation domain-containing protein n=1 Tax=Paenibacillus nasutitermitis TaxID=1652958 RepID=A0A916Z2B3_9BACL|nr:alpha-amylase family protein [Paenibacillus nasutitermitis]GGD72673.1 hypothetical protein GCM10010911_33170 [Paenibacillus nasutitermitis]
MNRIGTPWYENSYRRNLVDMHIPDWDEQFMSRYDADRYAALLQLARVDTVMIPASSCLGISYWPTSDGHMHNGLKGKDLIGEVIAKCKEAGMNVIVYSNFWSKWAYDEHPDWRFVSEAGRNTAEYLWTEGRYGVCCFNTSFRSFMLSQIVELSERYTFEGLWIDMIHWPYSPCYCGGCKARYKFETGGEIPRTIDWTDPAWVRFQRIRERWLSEFAEEIRELMKEIKPEVTVGLQCASWSTGWINGFTNEFFKQTDYASGDFYGDALQQSFICKALYALSENQPFEFMTSRCPDLTDHTTTKSQELLRAQAFSAITNGGAFLFIDAIDPMGTLNEQVYERMGEIYSELEAYEPFLDVHAKMQQDVAIYMNFESQIDFAQSGQSAMVEPYSNPIAQSAMNAAKSLMNANISFGVISKKNMKELSQYAVVILPDLLVVDEEEIEAFRAFVKDGGGLYASKRSTLYDKLGNIRTDFGLADVFGVSYKGMTKESVTYAAPAERFGSWFKHHSKAHPLLLSSDQAIVEAHAKGGEHEVEWIASQVLPIVDPADKVKFASAISNPPQIAASDVDCSGSTPAIVMHKFGQGTCIYSAGPLEMMKSDDHRDLVIHIIRALAGKRLKTESDSPKCVEAVWFHHEAARCYSLRVLNFQDQLPNIPVRDISFQLHLQGVIPRAIYQVPQKTPVPYSIQDDMVSIQLPTLETFAMIMLEY